MFQKGVERNSPLHNLSTTHPIPQTQHGAWLTAGVQCMEDKMAERKDLTLFSGAHQNHNCWTK